LRNLAVELSCSEVCWLQVRRGHSNLYAVPLLMFQLS
jgi:hypothetical protein